ncbi:MAG: hypothetical protein QOD12_2796, partial [Verrucomicrobiota bacterium]
FVGQQQAARVISEHLQSLGEGGIVRVREVEAIDGPVKARVSIAVGAEAHADALEEFHDGAGRIMCASVERHVLEKMSESALILFFVERSCENQEPQRSAPFRFLIGANDIAKAVGQRAKVRRGIRLEITGLLRERQALFRG